MSRGVFRGVIVALAVVIALLAAWRVKMIETATALPDYGAVAPFAFTDQDGNPFGSQNLVGKNWVADFIFTRCMGPCPLITTRLSELQKKFHSKTGLAFVSFSVDPDFDRPAVLKKYADNYGANGASWKFLTGPSDQVYALIRSSFKAAVARNDRPPTGQTDILHSTYFVLVDGQGHVRGFYNSLEPMALAALNHDIDRL